MCSVQSPLPPGRKVVWFSSEWPPGQHPNRGPMVCMASPDGTNVETRLVVEDFANCRHPNGAVFYLGWISNLGAFATGSRVMMAYFPELQSDWEQP